MRKRDLDILKVLERFRVLDRDSIINLHFSHLKHPITSCNTVLKRLRRDGQIEVNTDHHPYLYFISPSPSPIKIVKRYSQLLLLLRKQDTKSKAPILNSFKCSTLTNL